MCEDLVACADFWEPWATGSLVILIPVRQTERYVLGMCVRTTCQINGKHHMYIYKTTLSIQEKK